MFLHPTSAYSNGNTINFSFSFLTILLLFYFNCFYYWSCMFIATCLLIKVESWIVNRPSTMEYSSLPASFKADTGYVWWHSKFARMGKHSNLAAHCTASTARRQYASCSGGDAMVLNLNFLLLTMLLCLVIISYLSVFVTFVLLLNSFVLPSTNTSKHYEPQRGRCHQAGTGQATLEVIGSEQSYALNWCNTIIKTYIVHSGWL